MTAYYLYVAYISVAQCNEKPQTMRRGFKIFGTLKTVIWQVSSSIVFLLHLFVYCHICECYAFNYGINIELGATCVEFLVSVFLFGHKNIFLLKIRFYERSQIFTRLLFLLILVFEINYVYFYKFKFFLPKFVFGTLNSQISEINFYSFLLFNNIIFEPRFVRVFIREFSQKNNRRKECNCCTLLARMQNIMS